MSVTIRLEQDEEHTNRLLRYLTEHTNNYLLDDIREEDKDAVEESDDSDRSDVSDDESYTNSLYISSEGGSDNEGSDKTLKNKNIQKKLELFADFGDYQIDYQGHTIKISYRQASPPLALMDSIDLYKTITVSCESAKTKQENLDILTQFILMTQEKKDKVKEEKISCYIADEGHWKYLSKIPKRSFQSVFHPKRDELLNDITSFNTSEDDYKKHGIPYKRNYLFYGPPGTGKTSMICALASEFNANLYLVNFSCKITDADFMRLVSKLPSGSIMVLEDIDALFTERVSNDSANHSMVSFSAILNTLDGIARKNKMVSVMTTNFKDRLDEALIRPGRIDMIQEFPLASESQIKEMFISYFGDDAAALAILGKVCRRTRSSQTSTAALQKYFFEHRSSVELLEQNLEKLTDLIKQYHQTVHNLYT